MVTPGGEVAFTLRHLSESLVLRERVQWYTTMLGKLASVPVVVDKLKEAGITNWAVAEFVQGSRTRRWGVGWSFGELRPGVGVARAVGAGSGVERRYLPFPAEFVVDAAGIIDNVGRRVDAVVSELPLRWMWKGAIRTGVGFATGNVWSRAARRKAMRSSKEKEVNEEDDAEEEEEEEVAFGFKITVKMRNEDGAQAGESGGSGIEVVIRWLKGYDSALFESFCGMIKRKLGE
jgi:23S rRNA (adenine1618-N6)-methyltransferase